jgi:hypothetical protein
VGFGPFSFDPVEQMVGAPVADLLAPLVVGTVARRPSASGPAVDVFPLAVPAGEGVIVPLGALGEVAVANDQGLLVITVPAAMASWARDRVGPALVRGPEAALSADGAARVARLWVRLRAGMRASLPLGVLGEIGIEAV